MPCTTGVTDRVPLSSVDLYTVPPASVAVGLSAWTVTSWSHIAPASASPLTMKIFRPQVGGFYQVVAHDGPRPLAGGQLNTFSVSIPVRPGDILGLNTQGTNFCSAGGQSHLVNPGFLADGQSAGFVSSESGFLSVSAVITPSNTFTIRKTKRNKKRGTATLIVEVPNAGELTASGKGVKSAGASAVISRTVGAPGAAKLPIKAKGKKKRTLKKTGKVKLALKITYTPASGDPATQSRKLRLKKKL